MFVREKSESLASPLNMALSFRAHQRQNKSISVYGTRLPRATFPKLVKRTSEGKGATLNTKSRHRSSILKDIAQNIDSSIPKKFDVKIVLKVRTLLKVRRKISFLLRKIILNTNINRIV